MIINIQQPLMTSFIARIRSYEVEKDGFSPNRNECHNKWKCGRLPA